MSEMQYGNLIATICLWAISQIKTLRNIFVPLIFLAYGTGVSRPVLTSELTNSVTQKETATILGINNSLNSVAQIVTPIVGGFMIEYLPSQTLPLLSAVIFASLLFFLRDRIRLAKK